MPHHTPLIATIVAGLTIAFGLGALAHRFRISPLVGYLAAGVIVGPFTPGYVADQGLAVQLAEIGVILLMFGVGLHFSLKDLLAVRSVALPGAIGQMAVATVLGMGLGHLLGWPVTAGLVFGLALSVASTVVLLRALQERRLVDTERGHIAVGWLIVEDLAMVLALVLLPALAGALNPADGGGDILQTWIIPLAVTLGKVGAFVAFMLIVGRRLIPLLLHYVAHTGSRELFRLAVFAIALGAAFGAAMLFDVSLALGAFFAGMILAESELSQRAAEETLPLRDAFAVLFFVSVGMLFNPQAAIQHPWPLAATVAIIVLGKAAAAYVIMRLFRRDNTAALTIAASLAQIGEFSFILATLGVGLNLLPSQARDLILGGAIVSILINPFLFNLMLGAAARRRKAPPIGAPTPANDVAPTALTEHAILVGFGRVGRAVAAGLDRAEQPFLLVEMADEPARQAQTLGFEAMVGNASDAKLLAAAGVGQARRLFVTIPEGFEAGGVVQAARRANPGIEIIARAHSDAMVEHLSKLGANTTILAEREIAEAMLRRVPGRSSPAAGSPPAAQDAAWDPARASRPILSDPEWALLSAMAAAPEGSTSKAALMEQSPLTEAHDRERLSEAFDSLVAKGLVARSGAGQVRLSPQGHAAAALAPIL